MSYTNSPSLHLRNRKRITKIIPQTVTTSTVTTTYSQHGNASISSSSSSSCSTTNKNVNVYSHCKANISVVNNQFRSSLVSNAYSLDLNDEIDGESSVDDLTDLSDLSDDGDLMKENIVNLMNNLELSSPQEVLSCFIK